MLSGGIRCGSDILPLKNIFSEPCLKCPPGCANEVDTGMPPDIAQLSLWQVERALASLSDGEQTASNPDWLRTSPIARRRPTDRSHAQQFQSTAEDRTRRF